MLDDIVLANAFLRQLPAGFAVAWMPLLAYLDVMRTVVPRRLLRSRILVAGCLAAWLVARAGAEARPPCSEAWCRSVEEKVRTTDAGGHGPDVCSDEWRSVVELRLGLQGAPDLPSRDSEAWCRRIDAAVRERDSGPAKGPSFVCDGVRDGTVEAMVCSDTELSALDRKLSAVYAAAGERARNEQSQRLAADQRGWVKGRDECWKSDDVRGCVRDEYRRRIAELQARYRLVSAIGPVRFACGGDIENEVVATFFATEPPTLIAERGEDIALMYAQPSGSGARYAGRNESFWEHQGEASITWGPGAAAMRCRKVP